MMRRTIPAVSFTTSHRALMMKVSRPLLGGDLTSVERHKACWDEMPLTVMGFSRKEMCDYYWRCMFEYGIRDAHSMTKSQIIMNWIFLVVFTYWLYKTMYFPCIYYPIFQQWPEYMGMEQARAEAQSWGQDVWCPDGKFVKPYFHISPPMLTMTIEEL